MSYKTILVIPDSHVKPGVSNERFSWLAQFILERKPDIIVNLGDFADMESLSSYDIGKKTFERRRYINDVESVIDAQKKLFLPIWEYNDMRRIQKHKLYMPEWHICGGNHDQVRITRTVNDSPQLDGWLKVDDLCYKEFGWQVHPFLEPIILCDIAFSHYYQSGVMGKPIGGQNPARMILQKMLMSCVAGHSHIRDYSEYTRIDGKRIQCLVAGCFFQHDEEYITGYVNKLWWRGITMLNYVHEGTFEPEFIPLHALKEKYGNFNKQA